MVVWKVLCQGVIFDGLVEWDSILLHAVGTELMKALASTSRKFLALHGNYETATQKDLRVCGSLQVSKLIS